LTQNSILLGLMNATDGQDEAFNEWYEAVHLNEVLRIPGMIRALRYRIAPVHDGDAPWTYLTVYEVKPHAVADIRAEIDRRAAAGVLHMSPVLGAERRSWFFDQISERHAG
jgi:hypothetical protein